MQRALVITTSENLVGYEPTTFENGQFYPGDEIIEELTEWVVVPVNEVDDVIAESEDVIGEPMVAYEIQNHEGWFYAEWHIFKIQNDRIFVMNTLTKERSYIRH